MNVFMRIVVTAIGATLAVVTAQAQTGATVSVREAVDMLTGLSNIASGYNCGEEPVPTAGSPGRTDGPKQVKMCQYKLDGPVIMKVARNLAQLRAIVQDAQAAQQKMLSGFRDEAKRAGKEELSPEKQAEYVARVDELLASQVPFAIERFTYGDFKPGSEPGQNQISPSDLVRLGRLIEEK